jgi:hypothetical protein
MNRQVSGTGVFWRWGGRRFHALVTLGTEPLAVKTLVTLKHHLFHKLFDLLSSGVPTCAKCAFPTEIPVGSITV